MSPDPAADVFNLIAGSKSKWEQNSGEKAGAPPGVRGSDEITLVIPRPRRRGVGAPPNDRSLPSWHGSVIPSMTGSARPPRDVESHLAMLS